MSGNRITPGLGMLVRADNRGLGSQCYEAWRHLRPERTLVIDNPNSPYASRHDTRYPDSWCVARPDDLTEPFVRTFLKGLRSVFTAETFYNWDICDWARDMGVRTVCQANPEFFVWATGEDPRPDVIVAPSMWRLDEMRAHVPDVEVLPFPVARDRLPPRRVEKVDTILHVAGHRAVHDRNGTALLFTALRFTTQPFRLIIRTQSDLRGARTKRVPDRVRIEIRHADVPEYPLLYEDADAMVMTRRYGGQSLPVNEARSLGLPVIVTDRDPERSWIPDERLRVRVTGQRHWDTQGGRVMIDQPDARDLAAKLDALVADPALARAASEASDEWARAHSWEALLPRYMETLCP